MKGDHTRKHSSTYRPNEKSVDIDGNIIESKGIQNSQIKEQQSIDMIKEVGLVWLKYGDEDYHY